MSDRNKPPMFTIKITNINKQIFTNTFPLILLTWYSNIGKNIRTQRIIYIPHIINELVKNRFSLFFVLSGILFLLLVF